jgi:hypothetical protein
MWRSDQPVRCSNKDLRRERHITESATLRIRFLPCVRGAKTRIRTRMEHSEFARPCPNASGVGRTRAPATARPIPSSRGPSSGGHSYEILKTCDIRTGAAPLRRAQSGK